MKLVCGVDFLAKLEENGGMSETATKNEQMKGMCQHGNFPDSCEMCKNKGDLGHDHVEAEYTVDPKGPHGDKAGIRIITPEEAQERQREQIKNAVENNIHPDAERIKNKLFMLLDRADRSSDDPEQFLYSLAKELSAVTDKYKSEEGGPSGYLNMAGLKDVVKKITSFSFKNEKEPTVEDLKQEVTRYLQETFGVQEKEIKPGEDDVNFDYMDARGVNETDDRNLDGKVSEVLSSAYQYSDETADYYRREFLPQKQKELQELHSQASQARDTGDNSKLQEIYKQIDQVEASLRINGLSPDPDALPLARAAKVSVYKYNK